MAKKRKKRKRRKQPPKKYAQIVSKMKKKGTFDVQKVLYEPKGEVKMSAIVLDFVEPYAKHTKTPEAYQTLIRIAMIAWNVALLPETEHEAMIDIPITNQHLSRADRKEIRNLLEGLIERKNKHFADYNRAIMDYQLAETKDGITLSIASSLAVDKSESES